MANGMDNCVNVRMWPTDLCCNKIVFAYNNESELAQASPSQPKPAKVSPGRPSKYYIIIVVT